MKIQFFNKLKPSEHFNLTVFGVTLFEFFIDSFYREKTIVFTILGLKTQVTILKTGK